MVDINVLEAGYARLFHTLVDWGRTQDSVQAMYVSGSLAKGTADAYSDLDLVIVVLETEVNTLLDDVLEVIGTVEPVVLEYRLHPLEGICVLSIVTDKWHRLDLVFGGSDSGILNQLLIPVFDPERLWDGTFSEEDPSPVSSDEVIKLATEFLRVLGLSSVVNGRGDVHVGHEGANLLRNMLIELLLMEPPRRTRPSAKKLLPILNDEQTAVLRGLPPVADDLEILNTFSTSLACIFLPRARKLIESLGGVWPAELEDATRAYLSGTLEI
ncbi:MAG: hypothetical protein CMQ20_07240 [Gammaproteobacteria bacterium]|jgi:hypothetical protein|nr:hypothetical protein [Gammaproteobacteria bacterium]|tara:strand:- start:180 stop:989 length:810 start_codon:yes stop_codon:yes gene_type:complete